MSSHEAFPFVVFEKGDRFYCLVKELSILESGDDLNEAYEKARKKKNQILKQFKTADLESFILPAQEAPKKRNWNTPLNFGIVCLFLMVPTMTILRPISKLIHRVSNMVELNPVDLIVKAHHRLENMPEIEKVELKQAIHSIANHIQEFMTLEDSSVAE